MHSRQEAVCLRGVKSPLHPIHKCTVLNGGRFREGQVSLVAPFLTWPPTADSTGATSGAVSHYQRPLFNPLIDDGLFPQFCLGGHHERTSSSADTLGQNSRCPWSPSCHQEGPPQCAIDHRHGRAPAEARKRGRTGIKEMENLKEGEFLFLQCAPLLTIISSFLNGKESGSCNGTNKADWGAAGESARHH